MASFWISALEQGLIFAIMAQGVYITYKILDFPDLSVDGTFVLGAASTAAFLLKGANPFLATCLSIIVGALGGLATGILHVRLKITNILSGILVMIALYSVNLRIMGKPNMPLFNQQLIFSGTIPRIWILAGVALTVKLLLDVFLRTKLGLLLVATGDNPQLVTSLGCSIGVMKILGLMISNGLVALAGSILVQYQGFFDVGMGSGIIVIGLASIILGQSILGRITFIKGVTCSISGAIVYKIIIALALKLGMPPTDLKFISAMLVVLILVLYKNSNKFSIKGFVRKGGKVNAASMQSAKGF